MTAAPATDALHPTSRAEETLDERVEDVPPNPSERVTGAPQPPPSKKGQALLAAFEAFVYIIVAVLVGIAVYVNIGIWQGWYTTPTLTQFSADSNFILAAGAVAVIGFEIRKERHGK